MAKITYTALRNADLAKLTRAAKDWQEAATDLSRLAGEAQHGMVTKSETAAWAGINADVTRPFVRKIANEVGDLHKEAKTVANLLQGANDELTGIQDKLDAEHRTASNLGITVIDMTDGTVYCAFAEDDGGGGPLLPRPDDGVTAPKYKGSADHTQEEQARKDRIEKTINSLLAKAARLDHDVSTFLAQARGKSAYDAGHKTYHSLEQAEGQRAASLAEESVKKQERGEELTPTQLSDLNSTLKTYGKNPEFATTFYRKLGAEDALRFQAQLSLDASAGEGTDARTVHSIQKHMGTALAAATRSPDDPTDARSGDRTHLGTRWVDQLTKAGRRELDLDPAAPPAAKDNPRGYQILGNVLRHGKYETEFLNKVGKDMVEFERERGGGDSTRGPWTRPEMENADQRLYLGQNGEAGYDPITGLMEALGHSPEAANDFFNDSTGGGQTGVDRKSNFAYFLGDENGEGARKWDPDTANMIGPENAGKVFGQDSLGHALEAGTSGRPYDQEGPISEHSREESELFTRVVEHFGQGGENTSNAYQMIKAKGELSGISPSLGNMAAEYMPDIQRIIASGDPADNIPTFGHSALENTDPSDVKRFLRTTTEDPEAYSSILHGQEATSAMAMENSMNKAESPEDLSDQAERASRPGARVAELADQGRAQGIEESHDSVEEAKKFNENLATGEKWTGRLLGQIPVGGSVAEWAVEDLTSAVFESAEKDPEEIANKVDNDRDSYITDGKERSAHAAQRAVLAAAERLGYDRHDQHVLDAAQDVSDDITDTHNSPNPG